MALLWSALSLRSKVMIYDRNGGARLRPPITLQQLGSLERGEP
ncbi:MAG: hypothetical protein ACYDEP_00550 [Acidimicrobiales bacterium]